MIVYKAVAVTSKGELSSLTLTRYSIRYIPGEVTRPMIGKLFAFQFLEDAREYHNWMRPVQIWCAQATGVIEAPQFIPFPDLSEDIELFWKGYGYIDKDLLLPTPKGTVFCRTLKLLTLVDSKQDV